MLSTRLMVSAMIGLVGIAGCGAEEPEEYGQIESEVTVCAGSNVLQGIDVSYYQGSINWSSVKSAGKSFAIIRVSDGTGFNDPKFETNWSGSKAAKVVHGTYQFFRPGTSATAQANLVISKLKAVG